MDERSSEQREPSTELSVHEQLYQKLYAYQFGSIDFLELLDVFEEILHIKTNPDQSNTS